MRNTLRESCSSDFCETGGSTARFINDIFVITFLLDSRWLDLEAEALRKVSLQNYKGVREIDLFLSEMEFEDMQSVMTTVSQKFDIEKETAEERLARYYSILSAPKSGDRDVIHSYEYFAGTSIDKKRDNCTLLNWGSQAKSTPIRRPMWERSRPPGKDQDGISTTEFIRVDLIKAMSSAFSTIDFSAKTNKIDPMLIEDGFDS